MWHKFLEEKPEVGKELIVIDNDGFTYKAKSALDFKKNLALDVLTNTSFHPIHRICIDRMLLLFKQWAYAPVELRD